MIYFSVVRCSKVVCWKIEFYDFLFLRFQINRDVFNYKDTEARNRFKIIKSLENEISYFLFQINTYSFENIFRKNYDTRNITYL